MIISILEETYQEILMKNLKDKPFYDQLTIQNQECMNTHLCLGNPFGRDNKHPFVIRRGSTERSSPLQRPPSPRRQLLLQHRPREPKVSRPESGKHGGSELRAPEVQNADPTPSVLLANRLSQDQLLQSASSHTVLHRKPAASVAADLQRSPVVLWE